MTDVPGSNQLESKIRLGLREPGRWLRGKGRNGSEKGRPSSGWRA